MPTVGILHQLVASGAGLGYGARRPCLRPDCYEAVLWLRPFSWFLADPEKQRKKHDIGFAGFQLRDNR